jgi:PmbA protein
VADLLDLCRTAIGGARDGEQAEAYAEETRRTMVRARDREVDSFSSSESRGVGVRVLFDGRLGYAWAADPGPAEAAELLAAARDNAAFATPDEANGLPQAAEANPIPGLFREAQADLGPDRKVALALGLERATTETDPAVRRVEEAIYGDAVSRIGVASTAGLGAEYSGTDCWCMVLALAERDGETQTGHAFRVGREIDELAWEEAAREAAERGARMLGAIKPKTERLPVILDPWAASSFLGVLAGSLSAEEVQKGRSLLADRVGEEVGSSLISLVDDGRLTEGPAAAPFDDEGVPTATTVLVERGVLRSFLHNTETARRGGAASTGNARRSSYRGVPGVAPSNLFVEAGSASPEELLGRAGRAVYVQEVTGVHSGANPVSGEFSVGATGLRVEGGTLAEPLREMTVASTLLDMLTAVTAIGADLRFFPGAGAIGTPTLLVGEMTVAGR